MFRLFQGRHVVGRLMSSRANPAVKGLGISEESPFHKLPPTTKTELLALYNSKLLSPQELGDQIIEQLLHFEEPTATKIVADFRNNKKVPHVDNKVGYFVGFIRKKRESAEGLQKPPSQLNSSGLLFKSRAPVQSSRELFLDEQLLLDEAKKELAYLESPVVTSLKSEGLQERYSALFNRILRVAKPEFLAPHRVKPVENVFKSFAKHSEPAREDFCSMVAVYARAYQPTLAFNTYRIMKAVGMEVDIDLFNTLLGACRHKRRSWEPILAEMEAMRVPRDAVSFELLIAACSYTGDYAEAVKFYTEAKTLTFELGALSASALLYSFQALNLREQGEEQWQRLVELQTRKGVQSNDVANVLLLRSRAQDHAACAELREDVEAQQDADLCGLLVKAYADTGHFKEAKEFFDSIPNGLLGEKSLLAIYRVYRKEKDFKKMEETFGMVKLLPDQHCKTVYLAHIQSMCFANKFFRVEPIWQEFKQQATALQFAREKATDAIKADRAEWVEWHSPVEPLQDEKTYDSLIRILNSMKPNGRAPRWETNILPFLLSVLKEAAELPSRSPEFGARLTTYFRFILDSSDLTPRNRDVVQKQAQLLESTIA